MKCIYLQPVKIQSWPKMDEKRHLLTKGRRVQIKRDNKNKYGKLIDGGTKCYRWKKERKR